MRENIQFAWTINSIKNNNYNKIYVCAFSEKKYDNVDNDNDRVQQRENKTKQNRTEGKKENKLRPHTKFKASHISTLR